MFSKDTSYQVALSSVPAALRSALRERSLDQLGILVAHMEGVQEDGTDGAGIPTAIATGIVSMVPIFSHASSSLAASPRLSSFSLASPSFSALSKPVEKRIRSRKGERLQG